MKDWFKRLTYLAGVLALSGAAYAVPTVSISSPGSNATVGSPVRITAKATSSRTITLMQVYVDGAKKYEVQGSSVDTSLSLGSGSHKVTVQAYDSSGAGKTSVYFKVGSTSTTSGPAVTIESPASGSSAGSPVRVRATASSSKSITLMQVYVDGSKKYEASTSSLDTSLSLATGSHKLTVQAFDSSGAVAKQSLYFNVSSTSSSSDSTSDGATLATFSDIEERSGWESCDRCSGPGGDGHTTPHSMTQNVSSPSMDGKSAEFWLGGTDPYASALWWKQLGARDAAKKFTYDLYFYLKNPSVSQALEFDVNQTVDGKMYIFGTECNIRGSKTWRVWDYYDRWVDTGIPCTTPEAYKWHHLVWEFERTSDGKMRFISVTLNGKKSYVNHYHRPKPKTTRELNVAFQLDGNSQMTDYSGWLDNVTLKIW